MNSKFKTLPSEKQTNILNAALKTFAAMGYRKASTADIATEAGISKSLLFHYFSTKIELFSYIFNYSVDLILEGLENFHHQEKEDLFEMIHRSNIIKLRIFKTHPYLYKFIYQSYYEENPEVQAIVRKRNDALLPDKYADTVRYMDRSKLKDGIPPEKILQIILWVSEGFLQNKLVMNETDPDRLLKDFEDWMNILKACFYKNQDIEKNVPEHERKG
jgi:AcrR family transcriptional regulator